MTGIAAGKTWSRVGPEVAPTSSSASGVWLVNEAAENQGAGTWPQPFDPESYVAIGTFSGSSTSSVEFTSIPTKYSTLRVRVAAESDQNYGHYVEMIINGQAAATCNTARTNAYSNTVSLAAFNAQGIEWFPYVRFPNTNTSSSLNFPNSGEYWFPNANSTTAYKSARWDGVYKRTTTYTGIDDDGGVAIGCFTNEQTAAITSLKLKRYTGNWIDYEITLFGTCDL